MKTVIIINGKGGVGKDTLCDIAAEYYLVKNVSTIDPFKEIARKYAGWNGEKDLKSRKFLSDLKQLFIDYNDTPMRYINDKVNEFVLSKDDILFIHCREVSEISKIVDKMRQRKSVRCVTLLITRPGFEYTYGNSSDDNVYDYDYDFTFNNEYSLGDLSREFYNFIKHIIRVV